MAVGDGVGGVTGPRSGPDRVISHQYFQELLDGGLLGQRDLQSYLRDKWGLDGMRAQAVAEAVQAVKSAPESVREDPVNATNQARARLHDVLESNVIGSQLEKGLKSAELGRRTGSTHPSAWRGHTPAQQKLVEEARRTFDDKSIPDSKRFEKVQKMLEIYDASVGNGHDKLRSGRVEDSLIGAGANTGAIWRDLVDVPKNEADVATAGLTALDTTEPAGQRIDAAQSKLTEVERLRSQRQGAELIKLLDTNAINFTDEFASVSSYIATLSQEDRNRLGKALRDDGNFNRLVGSKLNAEEQKDVRAWLNIAVPAAEGKGTILDQPRPR